MQQWRWDGRIGWVKKVRKEDDKYIYQLLINISIPTMEEVHQPDNTISAIQPIEAVPPEFAALPALLQIFNGKLLKAMTQIRSSEKIHGYLRQINLTADELLKSYQEIIECNKNLVKQAQENQMIREHIKTYFDFVIEFLNSKNADDYDCKGKTVWYIEIEVKLHCCSVQLFEKFREERDITSSPNEAYPKVWERIKVEPAKDLQKLKKDNKSLKRKLHMVASAVLNESTYDFAIAKLFSFGVSCSQYLIMNDSAKLRSFIFYRRPTIDIAQTMWNLPQNGATKHLSKITFEGIKNNIKLYIPADGVFNANVDIFEERPNTIMVRLLSNQTLRRYPDQEIVGCCASSPKNHPIIQDAIFHMHGGGFVALSSRSMQNYTRIWANKLSIPVFSIDYRMPPEHPFPQAPHDCLTVYKFILDHIDHYLNIKPSRVYLAGDSAGGNLACVLSGLILKNKLTIPRGIYLSYPAADLRKFYSPSRVHSITDPLLWPTMLMLCMKSYLQGDLNKGDDPLASPVLLTQQYVSGTVGDKRFPLKWPKTIVTVGNCDPLYDDSLTLMQRMVESNIDCECIVYDGFSHGYLSTSLLISESGKTIEHSVDHLKKLINSKE